jgi:hypothetical protein
MLNPMDTTTSPGEVIARQLAALQERVTNLERRPGIPFAEVLTEAEGAEYLTNTEATPGQIVLIKYFAGSFVLYARGNGSWKKVILS